MEAEFVKRKGEIEKEKFARMQALTEEYQQKENERDAEKSDYFKELEVSLMFISQLLSWELICT
jgi:hypothetical protein